MATSIYDPGNSQQSVSNKFDALTVASSPVTVSKQQESIEPNHNFIQSHKPAESLPGHFIWLIPVWGVIAWALLVCTTSELWKLLRFRHTDLQKNQQVPCKNCRFFSSNFYLKCAVRPTDALTDRATDCSDYCPRELEEMEQQKPTRVRH